MRKLTIPGCVLVLLLAANAAWAGGDSGLYLGGSLGSAGFDVSEQNVDFDDATAYKIFAGYNFGIVPLIDVAIEGSYVNFGSADGSLGGNNAEAEATGIDAFGLVGVNLGPVSVFGKAGAISWDTEFAATGFQTEDDSGTDPAYGVGLQFRLLSFAIRAEYELFALEDVDIGFISAGVAYTF